MTKRVRAAAQVKDNTMDTNTSSKQANDDIDATPQSAQALGRPAPVHFEELCAIWPADPRIPSVESRRRWALARNITPSYIHNWWNRRKSAAEKLKLKIPADTYELSVGTPPVVPVVVKDEPTEIEIPATMNEKEVEVKTAAVATPIPPKKQPKKKTKSADTDVAEPKLTKKNLKRKRDESPSDDVPEHTAQPKSKKKKVTPAATSDTATMNDPGPTQNRRKIKTEPDLAGEAAALLAPTKQSKKRMKRTVIETPTTPADDVPQQPAPPKKNLKRKSNTAPDDTPEPPTQSKRKAAKAVLESSSSEAAEVELRMAPPRKKQKKKTVRFDSPSANMPPSSSPTLRASSPPASDALTAVDDTPVSSPLSKSANRASTRSSGSKDLDGGALTTKTQAAKAKENTASAPLKSVLKARKPPKKRKFTTASAPAPEDEEEVLPCCDQGNADAPTGFTCALCRPSTDSAEEVDAAPDNNATDEPKEVFDWKFTFPSFPYPAGDYTGVSVDVTPLSALPFLASPAAFVAAQAPPAEVSGLAYDADGCTELDGLRFSYDGMFVGEEGAGEFFLVLPTGGDEWKGLANGGLLLDADGNWLSDGAGGSGGDYEGEDVWAGVEGPVLRLPSYEFSDSDDEEDG